MREGVWIIVSERYAILRQESTRDPLGRGNLKTHQEPIRMSEIKWNRGGVWTSSFLGQRGEKVEVEVDNSWRMRLNQRYGTELNYE